jgi:type II secretory pathway pseudopilin PulG
MLFRLFRITNRAREETATRNDVRAAYEQTRDEASDRFDRRTFCRSIRTEFVLSRQQATTAKKIRHLFVVLEMISFLFRRRRRLQ